MIESIINQKTNTKYVDRTKIEKYIDTLLQTNKFKDEPESNGLLVKGKSEVKKIGLAVNTSFNIINICVKKEIDFLVVHHPPWKDKDFENYYKKIKILKNNGISLYAAHDCLDCSDRTASTSQALAQEIGIKITGRFARWDFMPWGSKRKYPNKNAYVGVYGIKKSTPKQITNILHKKIGIQPKIFINNEKIEKIAVIAGGGLHSFWIKKAKELGCDTFLTGEGTFFGSLYGSESNINIVLASHYATEKPALMLLAEKIKKELNISTELIEDVCYG